MDGFLKSKYFSTKRKISILSNLFSNNLREYFEQFKNLLSKKCPKIPDYLNITVVCLKGWR